MADVLGLSFFFHDSAAAWVRDGRILAAAAEERFTRQKHTSVFPARAIEFCLEQAGVGSINDLDAIIFYEKPMLKLQRVMESALSTWPRGIGSFSRQLPAFLSQRLNVYRVIERELSAYKGPILFSEHHLSHAASAFFGSPFERAAILTMDGVGERETTAIGIGEDEQIRMLKSLHFPHSVGLLYSALTSYLGFEVNDAEWKVMGLAAYGRPAYLEPFRRLICGVSDHGLELDLDFFAHHYSSKSSVRPGKWKELFGFGARRPDEDLRQEHKDLAHSGQKVVEEIILSLARQARALTGCDRLVIAGGVGLNGLANWKIQEAGIFKDVWVQPAAGDDGAALGAALLASRQLFKDPSSGGMAHAYLGPAFDHEQVRAFLERGLIPYELLTDDQLIERVADLLADGKVVGWMQGRMEFGPRALGARSILADPTRVGMKDLVNSKIKYRESFRPFAPAVPLEDVHEFFEVEPGTELPFMVKVLPVRPEKRAALPAITHQDGTARVQTVRREDNPLFHRLLQAMRSRTGAPVLLNTSFNVRGEPIVCTPEDAYACFKGSGIDVLLMGNHLISQKTEHGGAPVLAGAQPVMSERDVKGSVLRFYGQLPFNSYSGAVEMSKQLMRSDRTREYPLVRKLLKDSRAARVLDLGCGSGWFAASCAYFHGASVLGIDLNPVAIRQARSLARLMGCEGVDFIARDLFEFEPQDRFDLVNSLGVLHHTADCHRAILRARDWVAPGGFLHLGLYHRHGRAPFLEHFEVLKRQGADERALLAAFGAMNPKITDTTHLESWFRDQVLHPHETQHTLDEVKGLLASSGFEIQSTSIRGDERDYEAKARRALGRGRYFPGFFTVLARRGR